MVILEVEIVEAIEVLTTMVVQAMEALTTMVLDSLMVVVIHLTSYVKYASFLDMKLINARTCLIQLLFLREIMAEEILMEDSSIIKAVWQRKVL